MAREGTKSSARSDADGGSNANTGLAVSTRMPVALQRRNAAGDWCARDLRTLRCGFGFALLEVVEPGAELCDPIGTVGRKPLQLETSLPYVLFYGSDALVERCQFLLPGQSRVLAPPKIAFGDEATSIEVVAGGGAVMRDPDARIGQLALAGERIELAGRTGDLSLETAAFGLCAYLFRGKLFL
jgi:hypothetical protein